MQRIRDNRQRDEVCRTILAWRGLEDLWHDGASYFEGPRDEAVEEFRLIQEGIRRHGFGKSILIRVAFDVWNGSGGSKIQDIMQHLEAHLVQAIGALIVAASQDPEAVDFWLSEWKDPDAVFGIAEH